MNETRALARWVCDLTWQDLPDYTKIKTKQCLLDYIACCILARNEAPAQTMIAACRIIDNLEQASVIGNKQKFSVEKAAMLNGALGHLWEIDDTHRYTMSHPGDSVIAAALAIGEWKKLSGEALLTAIVAGYEVSVRVCESVSPSHLVKGWHPTGTANTFAAAAVAGKLLGFDAELMASCLGIAATQAAGIFCHVPERAMTKDLNPGKAAANGVLSALLAQAGFTGSPSAIENKKGFINTHADDGKPDKITAGLGESYAIDGIAFKPYACCRHCHSAINAAMQLAKTKDFSVAAIESITVDIYPMAEFLVDDPEPFEKGFYGTRYSVQFNIALGLLEGEEGLAKALCDQDYVAQILSSPQIREIMAKISIHLDDHLAKEWPDKWPARVTMQLKDGASLKKLVEYPLGEPENPMIYDQLLKKFRDATKSYLSEAEMDALIKFVEGFETATDASELMRLIANK